MPEYEWEASSPTLSEAGIFPGFLLAILATKGGPRTVTAELGKVGPGGRNAYLFSRGAALKYKGDPYEAIEAVLFALNQTMCDPPHSDGEVRRVARDAFNSNPISPARPATGVDAWVARLRQARSDRK